MTASPYASAGKITEALAVIGQSYVDTKEYGLYVQIAMALANRNAAGGDPMQNTIDALGGSILATTKQGILSQIFVLAATA